MYVTQVLDVQGHANIGFCAVYDRCLTLRLLDAATQVACGLTVAGSPSLVPGVFGVQLHKSSLAGCPMEEVFASTREDLRLQLPRVRQPQVFPR